MCIDPTRILSVLKSGYFAPQVGIKMKFFSIDPLILNHHILKMEKLKMCFTGSCRPVLDRKINLKVLYIHYVKCYNKHMYREFVQIAWYL